MNQQRQPPATATATATARSAPARTPRRAPAGVGGIGTIAIGAFVGIIGLGIPSIAPARECRADCVPAATPVVSLAPDSPLPTRR